MTDVVAIARTAWAPPPALLPSEWAERYRRLPESSAARGSRWTNAAAPPLAGIMDATRERGVRRIVLMKAAQCGGSECIANVLGHAIHLDPCPVLLAHPTYESVVEWLKEHFDDMTRNTPELAARVRDRRAPRGAHQGESTITLKRFPGGYLAGVGGNSPNAYARRAVRLVIADDAERLPVAVSDEGDPAQLLATRTATFHDGLALFVSTPTIEGGRTDQMFQASDRRRYFLACPCGRQDYVTWNDGAHFRVAYDGDDARTAGLECPGCHVRHGETERRRMIASGFWKPTAEPKEPGHVGFHLPATLSTLGSTTLEAVVARWLSARREGREALRAFVNTVLGEAWQDRDAPKVEPHTLLCRREDFGADVPSRALALTAGVDVQSDRLEVQVIAWGEHLERWVVDWTPVPGDPRQPSTWAMLTSVLAGTYEHASGVRLPIHATCVDSGFLADEVYAYVLSQQHRRVYAIKGESHATAEPLVMKASERTFGRNARPVRLYRLNVDAGKAELVAALAMPAGGPGSIHFGAFLGEPYFVQLTAERRERYYVHGVARERWTKQEGARNEAFDTAIYARAAFDIVSANRHDALVRRFREELSRGSK